MLIQQLWYDKMEFTGVPLDASLLKGERRRNQNYSSKISEIASLCSSILSLYLFEPRKSLGPRKFAFYHRFLS
jgi:hypothetical protein